MKEMGPKSSSGIQQRKPVTCSPPKDDFPPPIAFTPLGGRQEDLTGSGWCGGVVQKTAHNGAGRPPQSGGSCWPCVLTSFHAHR